MNQPSLAFALFRQPRLIDLDSLDYRVVRALRAAVIAHGARADPRPRIATLLGGGIAVAPFLVLVDAIGDAWPDPVMVARPCCPCATHDEWTIGRMVGRAAQADRPGFDRLVSEMLAASERDLLFGRASVLAAAMAPPLR